MLRANRTCPPGNQACRLVVALAGRQPSSQKHSPARFAARLPAWCRASASPFSAAYFSAFATGLRLAVGRIVRGPQPAAPLRSTPLPTRVTVSSRRVGTPTGIGAKSSLLHAFVPTCRPSRPIRRGVVASSCSSRQVKRPSTRSAPSNRKAKTSTTSHKTT